MHYLLVVYILSSFSYGQLMDSDFHIYIFMLYTYACMFKFLKTHNKRIKDFFVFNLHSSFSHAGQYLCPNHCLGLKQSTQCVYKLGLAIFWKGCYIMFAGLETISQIR